MFHRIPFALALLAAATLTQAALMTDAQIARYNELRGYSDEARDHSQHQGHH